VKFLPLSNIGPLLGWRESETSGLGEALFRYINLWHRYEMMNKAKDDLQILREKKRQCKMFNFTVHANLFICNTNDAIYNTEELILSQYTYV